MIIHKIAIKDTFETFFNYKNKCTGAAFDPAYNPEKEFPLPGLKEIPVVSAVKYEEQGNASNTDYINDTHFLEIGGNKAFIVDFIVWTKDVQIKLVCKTVICDGCQQVEKVTFDKKYSAVELFVDKPDSNDNTNILYNVKEVIALR